MNHFARLSKPSLRSMSTRKNATRMAPQFLYPAMTAVHSSAPQSQRVFHTFHTPDENPLAYGAAAIKGQAPFKKHLAANRGEIATRINRAAAQIGCQTAGIYSHEGKNNISRSFSVLHRESDNVLSPFIYNRSFQATSLHV